MSRLVPAACGLFALALLAGCTRTNNMTDQPRYEPYRESTFFADSTSARFPPAGTIPRVAVAEGSGAFQAASPSYDPAAPRSDLAAITRGRERFDIYCSPCHGIDGFGRGMIEERGFPRPPSLHNPYLRRAPDAQIYRVISNGLGKMPPYALQVPPADRWAIVAFVRALQLSQHAPMQALSPQDQERISSAPAGPPANGATAPRGNAQEREGIAP